MFYNNNEAMKNIIYDIITVYNREIKHFLKNKASIVTGVTQPIFWFVFMGFGMNRMLMTNPDSSGLLGAHSYINYILPGILVMIAMNGGLFGGAEIINDIRFGYINKLLSSPIHRISIVLGKLLSVMIQSLIQFTVIILIAVVFGVRWNFEIFSMLLIVFVFCIFCIQMGSISTILSVKLKTHQVVYALLGFLNVPLLFTSTAFFPSSSMPTIIKYMSFVNPLTYAVKSIRGLMFNSGDNVILNVCLLCAGMLLFLFLATRTFIKEYE